VNNSVNITSCAPGQIVLVEGGGYICAYTQCPKPPSQLPLLICVFLVSALLTAKLVQGMLRGPSA
jgi:hypothetical protein